MPAKISQRRRSSQCFQLPHEDANKEVHHTTHKLIPETLNEENSGTHTVSSHRTEGWKWEKRQEKSQQSKNWLIELDKIDQHLRCTDWKQKNVKFRNERGDITTEPTAFKRQWVAWRGGSAITCCSCKGLRILFPASTRLLPTGESDTLFWPLWLPLTHVVHIHTSRQNTHTHAIKINLKKQNPTTTTANGLLGVMAYAFNLSIREEETVISSPDWSI